jgi:cation diffusion facilitator CzcD-associated flavoprotein CzcO
VSLWSLLVRRLTDHGDRPELYKGKRVLVVGVSNTGADAAAALCGHAEKVWISHSHGVIVVSCQRLIDQVAMLIVADPTKTQRHPIRSHHHSAHNGLDGNV